MMNAGKKVKFLIFLTGCSILRLVFSSPLFLLNTLIPFLHLINTLNHIKLINDNWFFIAAVLITGGKLPYGSFTAELYLPSSARHMMLATLNEERYDHTVSEDGLICGGNGWVESVHKYLSKMIPLFQKNF